MSVSTCLRDGTPLVYTHERPKNEWHCLSCGAYWPLFHTGSIEGQPAVQFQQQLVDLFATGARGPMELPAPLPPPVESADNIKCHGCGLDSGRTVEQGKPRAWYSRKDDDGEQIACSDACIDKIAAATGKSAMKMPW